MRADPDGTRTPPRPVPFAPGHDIPPPAGPPRPPPVRSRASESRAPAPHCAAPRPPPPPGVIRPAWLGPSARLALRPAWPFGPAAALWPAAARAAGVGNSGSPGS
jgi:hypothetical protein